MIASIQITNTKAFETRLRSFIIAFSICITVPLKLFHLMEMASLYSKLTDCPNTEVIENH